MRENATIPLNSLINTQGSVEGKTAMSNVQPTKTRRAVTLKALPQNQIIKVGRQCTTRAVDGPDRMNYDHDHVLLPRTVISTPGQVVF